MILRPHTIRIYPASQNIDSFATVLTPSFSGYVEVRGLITPMTQDKAVGLIGEQLNQPHRMFVDPSDAASIAVGNKVVCSGAVYDIKSPARVFNLGFGADHASCVLECLS